MSGWTLGQTVSWGTATAFRTVVIGLALYGGLDLLHGVMAQDQEALYLPTVAQAAQVQSLEERVATLEDLLVHVSREGNDIYVTGANLHVVNGTGATETTNGLGNVIVGYNEDRRALGMWNARGGSHMLVVGYGNNFTSYGGIVAGSLNSTTGPYASVSGGAGNVASGEAASVSGGNANVASGALASVSGGGGNLASGRYASVGGGEWNEASGELASVSGGRSRAATGDYDWRAGDLFQPE
jgi:hypothetical protein